MNDCKGSIHNGIYNCWGTYDHTLCYHCEHDAQFKQFEKTGNMFKSQKNAIDELFRFLKGEKLPEGTHCKMPKLKPKLAFTVIWFLQEHMHCLPDNIEQCQGCEDLFDTDSEGYYLSDDYCLLDEEGEVTDKTVPKKYWGHWCDGCVPGIEFGLK